MEEYYDGGCQPFYYYYHRDDDDDDDADMTRFTPTTKTAAVEEDQAKDMLRVMLQQEAFYYQPHQQQRLWDYIDPLDRQKLVRWCRQVMDYCKLDRSLVEVVMNYTDRYVAAEAAQQRGAGDSCYYYWTWTRYQLVAMTAVYTTVKIFGVEAMDPLLVSLKLSRGAYTVAEIERQERDLLRVLQWKMNPPTTAGVLGLYLDLVARALALPLSQQYAVYDCAMEQAMASLEYDGTGIAATSLSSLSSLHPPTTTNTTINRRPSAVAFAALVTALRLKTYASHEKIAWATSLLPVPYSSDQSSIIITKQQPEPEPQQQQQQQVLRPPHIFGSPRSVTFPTVVMLPLR
jgi:hypothetical protein